jgi:hypothetical protein
LDIIGFLRGGPVLWVSRKQTLTATSTTRSKFLVKTEAPKDGIWLRRFNKEISRPKTGGTTNSTELPPVTVFNDSQPAVKLPKNPEFHHLTKYLDVAISVSSESYGKD